MFELSAVVVGAHVLQELQAFMRQTGDGRAPELAVEQAIRFWIDHHGGQRQGYQWKSLFLPAGTQLRMCYRGEWHLARVEGNAIVHQGQAMSPRQFVIHVTGSVRNAWRELWLHCPGDERWHLADTRRGLLRRFPDRPPARQSKAFPPPLPAQAPRPRGPQCEAASALDAGSWPREVARLHAWEDLRRRRRLRRNDSVRDDQPDLRARFGHGLTTRRYTPGRPGMPERRGPPVIRGPFTSGRREIPLPNLSLRGAYH